MRQNHLKTVLALIAAALPLAAMASEDPCDDKAQTQAALNECAFNAWKRNDVELNRVYQQIGDRLRGDEKARQLLVDAQRKWLSFRDAECTFQSMRSAGGSIHPMVERGCQAEITRNRVTELQNMLACTRGADEQSAADCAVPRAGK